MGTIPKCDAGNMRDMECSVLRSCFIHLNTTRLYTSLCFGRSGAQVAIAYCTAPRLAVQIGFSNQQAQNKQMQFL